MAPTYEELVEKVKKLSLDPSFGILTSPALVLEVESRRPVSHEVAFYLDIDDMKTANARYGLAEVDQKISTALRFRKADAIVMGRWHAGDEIAGLVDREDVVGFCDRLHRSFREQSLSCTIAVAPVDHRGVNAAIADAEKLCSATKKFGQKGTTVFLHK